MLTKTLGGKGAKVKFTCLNSVLQPRGAAELQSLPLNRTPGFGN